MNRGPASHDSSNSRLALIASYENFGFIELEFVAGYRRMSRDLRIGIISPHCCRMFGNSRLEQSSRFSDVVALSESEPETETRNSSICFFRGSGSFDRIT
ncbi:unnamed protein product [Schistocephalus solidus]|uniref:Uncharacterized protein n=1 Tax=Schistocephalus solidus TaxID=70667 RepID=A0A183SN50_SCHSO|nr:unnamed protein product [Schistocephalus solidus]